MNAHKPKTASRAVLNSDAAGDQAAQQDTLVNALGNKRILRTKDYYKGAVAKPEIEDLLSETLLEVAKSDLGWDGKADAAAHPTMSVVDALNKAAGLQFSKYKLAKAFLRWTRTHSATDLSTVEQGQWADLIGAVNSALK